jgi:hypothetical protein
MSIRETSEACILPGGHPQTGASPTEPREARLFRAPRCLAQTRRKTLCQRPALKGRKRCALHGCAHGAGGQSGKANGSWKHGAWSNDAADLRREAAALLKLVREGVGV